MLTYEEVTACFLKAAASVGLTAHPEYWMNTRSLEREFACTCHAGSCEEAESRSSCTLSFTWGALDTALSLEGPAGVCTFFHEEDYDCPHLHTRDIPPLVVDLSYSLSLNGASVSEGTLLMLTQMLKLRASEHSRRTVETRPSVSITLHDQRLVPDVLTVQQRVELPIWHPDGMRGLLEGSRQEDQLSSHASSSHTYAEGAEIVADNPRPEEWLPQVLEDVCQDVLHVLAAFDTTVSYNLSENS